MHNRRSRLPILPALAVCLLMHAAARAVPLSEIPIGTSHLNVEDTDFLGDGSEVTYLVIDFRAAGGGSFAFGYRHDGADTALDMLESFAAEGVLEVAYEDFAFGPAVRGIGYPREEQADVFPGAFDGPRSWVLWDGSHEESRVEWTDAVVGINGVEFGNTEPTVFLPGGGFIALSTWSADDHPYPGPSPLTPLPGDFDSNGVVDGHDLLAALAGFGTAAGPTLAAGDADRDGDVDRNDILLWRENVGAAIPTSPAGATSIPEPGGAVLISIGLGALLLYRMRARRSATAVTAPPVLVPPAAGRPRGGAAPAPPGGPGPSLPA